MTCNALDSEYAIAKDSDWYDDIAVFIQDVDHPDDLTGYEADLYLEPTPISGNQTPLAISTQDGNGYLTLSGNLIQIRVPQSVLDPLAVQNYLFSVRLTHPGGYKEPFLKLAASVVPFGNQR